jgi:hypothetical protein
MYCLSILTVGIQLQKYFSSSTFINRDINAVDLEENICFLLLCYKLNRNGEGGEEDRDVEKFAELI